VAKSPRPVTVSSPHPPHECLRRLTKVTSARGADRWYLDPKTAVLPDPLFRGDVKPARVHVAGFMTSANSRYRPLASWLDAEIEPAAGGGTTLTGTVGPNQYDQEAGEQVGCLIATVGLLMCAVSLIIGVVKLASGHIASGLPPLLIPIPVAAGVVYLIISFRKMPDPGDEASAKLMRKVARLLNATVDYPDEAPAPQVTAPAPADDTSASTERD
jgi:hypothetical protein